MQNPNPEHLFDIKNIMYDVEKVIQRGLNKLLTNYIERYELLEKTHQQLIQLPSIAEEFNRKISMERVNGYDFDSDTDTKKSDSIDFINIKDITENIVRLQVSNLENKLHKIEEKYEHMIPILDKLVNKITNLNDEIKEIKEMKEINNNTTIQKIAVTDTIQKSSIVTSSENENIKIHIKESTESNSISEQNNTDEKEEEEEEVDQVEEQDKVEEEQEEEEQEEEEQVEDDEEEDVNDNKSVETETKEEEEEEEEIFEIEIDDKNYCTNDDENGFIWELTEEGEQGEKVGYLKDGEPFFYADEE